MAPVPRSQESRAPLRRIIRLRCRVNLTQTNGGAKRTDPFVTSIAQSRGETRQLS
jgi:hypothetical protein